MGTISIRWVLIARMPYGVRLFAEKASNFVARKKFGIKWITRRLMHSQEDALPRFAGNLLRERRSGADTPSYQLLQVLTDWHAGTISHDSAVQAGTEIAERVDVLSTPLVQLQVWERLCQNFGHHQVSGLFAQKCRERISLEANYLRSTAAFEREFLSSLHWGDVSTAEASLSNLRYSRLNPSQTNRLRRYETYFQMWVSPTEEPSETPVFSAFSEAVASRKVLVYGPGEVTLESLPVKDFEIVVRTSGLGRYIFESPGDLINNKTDIVYVNPEVFDIGSRADRNNALRLLSSYRFVVTKRSFPAQLPNGRVSTNLGPLFLRGHPHKGTLVILDLLFHHPRKLFVIGMNFFLARQAYREDSLGLNALRMDSKKRPSTHDPSGSEGGAFDLNWQYASHNLRENFGLVRNLYAAGLVSGDEAFSRVMKLTIDQYLSELDKIAGRTRL